MEKALQVHVDDEGVAWLVMDQPRSKVNTLSSRVLEEWEEVLTHLSKQQGVRALVLQSRKPGIFVAGADLDEISQVTRAEMAQALSEKGQSICNRLSSLPFPSIAAIDGVCLGGGLELALACTYRVITDHPSVKVGLPEVNLGIIPGWGGTQRLPALIGLSAGLTMILAGKQVDGKKAFKMGIADAIYAREFLAEGLQVFLSRVFDPQQSKKIRKPRGGISTWFQEKFPLGRALVFRMARKNVLAKSKGHYPAPLKALSVIEESFGGNLHRGLREEAKAIASLMETSVAGNLISLFRESEALKKESGIEGKPAEELKEIGPTVVLGAGIMGGGIGWLFAHRGGSVRMKDIAWESIAKGYETVQDYNQQLVKRRKLRPHEANLRFHRVSGTLDYTGMSDAEWVVEAVVENMDLKKKVFSEIEEKVSDTCILCSNTSSLSITEMATCLKKPERFVGLHFFNPVNRMPLVEVIPGEKTSEETIVRTVALVKKLGKTPVVVADCAGFLVNRVLLPALNEAGWLFEEGVSLEQVDGAMKEFGLPMGPFTLADEVGIDVGVKVCHILEQAYGNRQKCPGIMEKIVERGFFGKKTGRGFYVHKGKEKKPNEDILSLQTSGISRDQVSDQHIVDRIVLVMLNEAARCLEEKVIKNPAYLDVAMVFGTGFPPFRGGLLRYADEVGMSYVVSRLEELSKAHGERFVPCKLLVEMKEEKKTFYRTAQPGLSHANSENSLVSQAG